MPSILQQASTATSPQRNLALLNKFSRALVTHGLERGKILSFGCSEGYECIDLHNTLPAAKIFGCDINKYALNRARDHCRNIATVFDSSGPLFDIHGPYDGIVTLNVLCRYPQCAGNNEISRIYPFEIFDETLHLLDTQLCAGGLIAIYNANYFFEEAKIFPRYSSVDLQVPSSNGWIEKYDRSGRRVTDLLVNWEGKLHTRADFFRYVRYMRNTGGNAPDLEKLEYIHHPVSGSSLPGSTKQVFWRKTQ